MTDAPAQSKPDWSGVYAELGITEPPYDDSPLAAHVSRHAAERPEALSMAFGPKTYSFADLDLAARRLARGLSDMGIGKGDVIGLHMPNIPQYMVALAAISRLGAIGSGLSPLLAPPEIAYQINDANMKAVIGLADLAPMMEKMEDVPDCLEFVIQTGPLDHLHAPDFELTPIGDRPVHRYLDVSDNDGQIAQTLVDPDDIFMIQYTGGTTGRPKGAMLAVRQLMHNFMQASAADPEYIAGEEVLASTFPMFHIAGLTFALCAMRVGGLFFLTPNPRDAGHFVDLLKAHPPTRMAAVPAFYEMLLAEAEAADVDYSGLHVIKTGAAPMSADTRDRLIALMGPGKMADVFGMTETAPCYLMHPRNRYKPGAVGIPMPGADVRIADVEDRDKMLPPGEAGEIISAGVHVMKGYLNLPGETDKALRIIDGKRFMYSGDVGYMDEEGYVFLCDRAKDMLIVGGFKVFSVEVEDKLMGLPAVEQCAIIGYPDRDRPGNDVVNLFVQRSAGVGGSDAQLADEITAFCRENMAPYKVPKRIHVIDEIPLTPVGKIDKKALRAEEPE
ncbi:MAG: class I adenylate-forming enzyme family protein [Pseudomonadota bacterium]